MREISVLYQLQHLDISLSANTGYLTVDTYFPFICVKIISAFMQNSCKKLAFKTNNLITLLNEFFSMISKWTHIFHFHILLLYCVCVCIYIYIYTVYKITIN